MSIDLHECLDLYETPGATPRVDREAGVIRRVKILGWQSANGRAYLPEGVDPARYEGRVVNANHRRRGEDRDVHDRLGRVTRVTKEPDGLYGDLEYLRSHPLAGPLAEAAERMPGVFGLSHTARGRDRAGSGGAVIEAVEEVYSVDLVGDPATVSGLYESRSHPVRKRIRDLIEALRGRRPGWSRGLREQAEAGVLSQDAEMEEPADVATPQEPADHEAALRAGFRAAVLAALDDESLDLKAKLAKIKEILTAEEKMLGGGKDTSTGTGTGDTPQESRRQPSEVDRLRLQLCARDLLTEARITPGRVLLKALDACASEQEVRDLIAAEQAAPTTPGARSAAPSAAGGAGKTVQEQRGQASEPPRGKDVGRWLKSGSN